jgi:hypothetical protein
MIALRIASDSHGVRRRKQLKVAQKIIKELEQWTKYGGLNCLHKLFILKAEYNAFRLNCANRRGFLRRGQDLDFKSVRSDFDRAIVTSTRTGFRNDAALAAERASVFCQQCNELFLARSYFSQAIQFYSDWGCCAKVAQMTFDRKSSILSFESEASGEESVAQLVTQKPREVDHSKLGISHLEEAKAGQRRTFFAESLSMASTASDARTLNISITSKEEGQHDEAS